MVGNIVLSPQDQALITAAIKKAEQSTSGEIVTVVTRQSDRYLADALGYAVLISFVVAFGLHWTQPGYGYDLIASVQLIVLLLAFAVLDMSGVITAIAPHSKREKAVRKLAREQFFANKLHTAVDSAAVLIFVSLREKRVEIIADSGIDEKVAAGTWTKIASELSAMMARTSPGVAIEAAINACAVHLTQHFPDTGNHNAFPDDAVIL